MVKSRKTVQSRKSKKSAHFIVEGFTEENYIRLLNEYFGTTYRFSNSEGGGAKSVLLLAQKIINQDDDTVSDYIVVYDTDTENQDKDGASSIKSNLTDRGVQVEPLRPCFESCLLAHFDKKLNTDNCDGYVSALKKNHIPNYKKNNYTQLKKYITKQMIIDMAKKYNCTLVKKYFIDTESK